MSTIKHQAGFRIDQPADVLFPLFSAEGEKLWVPGWDYRNIMGSTGLHEDYVFLTKGHHTSSHPGAGHHNHDHDHHAPGHHAPPETIWLVKRYDPANFLVQFYRVEPGDKIAVISVHCKPLDQESTEVEVAYEYIGLSLKGDKFIEGYTKEVHQKFISNWHRHLVDYFETRSG